jgi:hypothetical protein
MKRTAPEQGSKKPHDDDIEDSDDDQLEQQWPLEPGTKRVNLPKKSKYRTRAHVNPMGDLKLPTYIS